MERLTAKQIKKVVYGVSLTDGHLEERGRFQLYSKHRQYVEHVAETLKQITGVNVNVRVRNDKRSYVGYVVDTNTHPYFKNIRGHVYGVRKELNTYTVNRIDELCLAHMYMCDGYTEHSKNRKTNKVQNIGWFCLEAFPREELEILQRHLSQKWGIESSLVKKPWGFGFRMRIGGENLQKFISIIYPHLLDCFKYKSLLYYKGKEYVLDLPNAEQYIRFYESVEDIVRYSEQSELT